MTMDKKLKNGTLEKNKNILLNSNVKKDFKFFFLYNDNMTAYIILLRSHSHTVNVFLRSVQCIFNTGSEFALTVFFDHSHQNRSEINNN